MSEKDLLTLSLSFAALLFSILSLILNRKWSKQAWTRESRIKYYRELNKLITQLKRTYINPPAGIYRRPDLDDCINEAKTLHLYPLYFYLETINISIDRAEKLRDAELAKNNFGYINPFVADIISLTAAVEEYVESDTNKFTGDIRYGQLIRSVFTIAVRTFGNIIFRRSH